MKHETRNAAYICAVRPAFYETRIWPQACARNAPDTREKTRSEYIRSRFAASLVKRVFRNAAQQPGPLGQHEDVRKILCGFCTCTRVGRKTVLYVKSPLRTNPPAFNPPSPNQSPLHTKRS